MADGLDPARLRRLLARTLRVALDGGPAAAQLVDRWAAAEASDDAWLAAITWDGIGSSIGWALETLDLRDVAPPALEVHAMDAYRNAREQAVQLASDLMRIGAEFEAMGVQAIALKGSALLAANYAPALGVRWMSDLDILVSERQMEQAAWVLESLDYQRGYSRDPSGPAVFRPYHEQFTGPEGQVVELHWRLGPARWGRAAAADAWFQRAEPSAMPGLMVPCAADLFWHFLLHDARNHAWSSGSLRAALDLALVARAPSFTVGEVVDRLRDDPRPGPLMEAIADAAHLSAKVASEVEPSARPRYLRLARWRDLIGRRRWATHRIAEAIAWGADFDRARRFGGWRAVFERALRVVPEAETRKGLWPAIRRGFLTVRHAGFVGALAAAHLVAVETGGRGGRRRALPPA